VIRRAGERDVVIASVRVLVAVVLGLIAGAVRAVAPVSMDWVVRIDPEPRSLAAAGTLTLPPGEAREVVLRADFTVESIAIEGRATPPERRMRDGLQVFRIPAATTPRRVAVQWRGVLAPLDPALDHRQTLGALQPVAGVEGTQLYAGARWHPTVPGAPATYRLTLDLPDTQRGLAPGRLVDERSDNGRYRAAFEHPHPVDGIDLLAGPYRVAARSMKTADGRDIRLRTYLHPSIAALSDGYLDSTQRYVELYDRTIGPYPYGEFSVVSSPTPTGFGLPAMTYLGIEVLKLPFIRATSLGHEVLHNWWGNGVRPDYGSGNWSEGLTTFMADYAYREREGDAAARAMRLEWLRDFAALPEGRDAPLARFTARTHGAAQIVGYHKAAMLFVMLRDRIGGEAFDRAVQAFWREHRFRTASWSDLRRAFEQASGEPLAAFFAQWLERSGAPALRLEQAAATQAGDGWQAAVTLAQTLPAYALRVPLVFRTPRGDETRWVTLDTERQTFRIGLDLQPTAVLLDPDFRVFRRLARDEAPPILRQTMLDAGTVTFVVSEGEAEAAARELAARLQEHAPRFAPAQGVPGTAPALVIGLAADVDRWLLRHGLPPRPEGVPAKGTAQVWMQARKQGGAVAIVSAQDAAALRALVRPLPHYGRQSFIAFDGAKALERGVWPGQPLELRLR
jgi:aminopeptidase N